MQPGSPAHHLAVKAAYLCGPQHYDTVHGRAVPSFGQKHGITKHVVFPLVEIFQDLRPVLTLPIDLRRTEALFQQDIPELLAGLDQWQEYHRFPLPTVFGHLLRNLVQVRVQGRGKIAGLKIPGLERHPGQIQFQGDCHSFNGGQIAFPDGPGEGILIGQALKHLSQISHVSTVRGSRHPQNPGFREMAQDLLVAAGYAVMGLVNDDGPKIILRELAQPLLPHQALYGPNHDPEPASYAGLVRLFHRTAQACCLPDLVRRLLQKLPAVGQDQDPTAMPNLVFRHLGKYNGFPAAGRQDQ